jgi:hypothetical protein
MTIHSAADSVIQAVIEQFHSGEPLGERGAAFASLLGDSLDVRVHTGPSADSLRRTFDAAAFATGSHIFFAAGRFEPDSPHGGYLLTHELAHVMQQRAGRVPGSNGRLTLCPAGDAFEDEAKENKAICRFRACPARSRFRRELHSRSKCCSLRITSHGPRPKIATRSAQSVMRKRDQELCVRGFVLPFRDCASSPQDIAPGGKWTSGLHQKLG